MELKDLDERVRPMIEEFLLAHDYGQLHVNELKYLEKAALSVQRRAGALASLKSSIDNNNITLAAMVADGVCSEGTILHKSIAHQPLRDFVKEQADKYNIEMKPAVSESTMMELRELRRQLELVVDKDAQLTAASNRIHELETELKHQEVIHAAQLKEVRKSSKKVKESRISDAVVMQSGSGSEIENAVCLN